MNASTMVSRLGGTLLLLSGCAATTGARLALTEEHELSRCGAAPNCVCSDETGSVHGIEPLALATDPQTAWRALIDYLEADPSYRILVQEPDYLRAEARTRVLRFVDDVEFHLRPERGQIAMRSASRLGFSDLGKNRRRLEVLRGALTKVGVVAAGE